MTQGVQMAIVPSEFLNQLMAKVEALEELLSKKKQEGVNNDLLSPEETAKMLGVSLRTLQSYRDNKLIPFAQKDRKIWIKRHDIIGFIDSLRIEKRKTL